VVCDSISAAGQAVRAKTIFVLLPESFQVQADDAARFVKGSGVTPAELDLDRPSLQLAAALSAKGLTVVDVMPALRAAVASGPRLYGAVDRHFSPDGHRIVTNMILPLVLERLSLKPAARP
jgi:hypothetical protein